MVSKPDLLGLLDHACMCKLLVDKPGKQSSSIDARRKGLGPFLLFGSPALEYYKFNLH